MKPGCIGKSNTNNSPAPTDLTENPYGKIKLFDKDETQKSARVVQWGIAIEFVPEHASRFLKNVLIFEKRGGADPN
jgi:hypothetical protein